MPVRRAGVVTGIPSSTYAKATQAEGMSQDMELELAAIEAQLGELEQMEQAPAHGDAEDHAADDARALVGESLQATQPAQDDVGCDEGALTVDHEPSTQLAEMQPEGCAPTSHEADEAAPAAAEAGKPAMGLKRKGFAAPRAAAAFTESELAVPAPDKPTTTAKPAAAPGKKVVKGRPVPPVEPVEASDGKENAGGQPAASPIMAPKFKPAEGEAGGGGGEAEGPKIKKSLNAYMHYVTANRSRVKAANPELDNKALTARLAELYRGLAGEELKTYQDAAAADKERYAAELELAGPQAKPAPPKSRQPRTKSAYQLFVDERWAAVKTENPKAGMPEISKLMSAAWKEVTDDGKAPYMARAKELKDAAKAAVTASDAGGGAVPPKPAPKKKRGAAANAGKPTLKRSKGAAPNEEEGEGEGDEAFHECQEDLPAGALEESDDEEERMKCDWAAHPAECILSETASGKFLVMRRGLDFTNYGLVDAAAVKAQRMGTAPGAPPCPVSLAMLDEYERFKKLFKQEVHANLESGELVLDDLAPGSALESCLLLGQLRRPTYELNRVPKNDAKMTVPMLRLCSVVQRMLVVERLRGAKELDELRCENADLRAGNEALRAGKSGAAQLTPNERRAVAAEA